MNKLHLASYIRTHRKRSGLSQKELDYLLGYPYEGQVSRHERMFCFPSLVVALRYQAIFHVPVSELFQGIYETEQHSIEEKLAKMEDDLHQCSSKGRKAPMTARKLEWLWERQNPEPSDSTHEQATN